MAEDVDTEEELTFIEVLDELEYYLANGRKLPLTSTVVVNEEDVLDLLDRIRGTLPVEIHKSREVVEQRGDIIEAAHAEAERHLASAKQEAEQIVETARDAANKLVEEHVVLNEAKLRATDLLAQAQANAESVTDQADKYAVSIMEQLESHLSKTLTTVRNGLESLPTGKSSKKKR